MALSKTYAPISEFSTGGRVRYVWVKGEGDREVRARLSRPPNVFVDEKGVVVPFPVTHFRDPDAPAAEEVDPEAEVEETGGESPEVEPKKTRKGPGRKKGK